MLQPASFLKNMVKISSISLISFLAFQSPAFSAEKEILTAKEKQEIGKLVREYILNNPEIIPEALELFKRDPAAITRFRDNLETSMAKLSQRQIALAQKVIIQEHGMIYNDQISPVIGNPKADVTIVEFYDYNCGFCKRSHSILEKLKKTDPNIKIIYKELPVLKESSFTAAIASLAANKQGKFEEFHTALMTSQQELGESVIYEIAKNVGLNVEQLKKDMQDPLIERALNDNGRLSEKMGITGTPTFIIGNQFHPGFLQEAQMKDAIKKARKNNKK